MEGDGVEGREGGDCLEEECRVREVVEETEEVWGERWERRSWRRR